MMIFHPKLKASVLISALGILGGFSVPALGAEKAPVPAAAEVSAQGPAAFYPSTPWDVKTLQDPASGTKICTVAALFNNGFFIQMTAAQQGINSISINFRQDIFSKGTTANVGISAPGVMKKILPAVAFKPELLAIDFQGQGALFDAIKTAGVMDFSMGEDNRFRFYLNGFAAALPRFGQCIKTHASAASGADIPVPVLDIPALPAPRDTPPKAGVQAVKAVPAKSAPPAPAVPATPALSVIPSAPPPSAARVVESVPAAPPRPPVVEGGMALVEDVPDEAPRLPPLPLEAARKTPARAVPAQAAVSTPAPDERAPKGPPNGSRRIAGEISGPPPAQNPLDPRVNAGENTTLRSANIEQEKGRAPPPPPRRLDEIDAPPVFTNTEPVIRAPSAEAIAKSRAALDKYEQEMMMVMPPEERAALSSRAKNPERSGVLEVTTVEPAPKAEPARDLPPRNVPPLEVITPESEPESSGVLRPGPRREPIKNRRLSQMLVDDMTRQYDEMSTEGRLRPDILQRLEEENAARAAAGAESAVPPAPAPARASHGTPMPDVDLNAAGPQYQLKPLVAPLIKRGTAEEKALADILSQPAPAQPPAAAPPTPVLPQSAPGVMARPLNSGAAPSAPGADPSPVLKVEEPKVNSVTIRGGQALPPEPPPGMESGPRINRQTKRIEADLTDFNRPPGPADVMPRQNKSWLDILREKQEAEQNAAIDMSPDAPTGVYIPGPPAAPHIGLTPVPETPASAVSPKKKTDPVPLGKPAPLSETVDIDRVPAKAPRADVPRLTPSKTEAYAPPAAAPAARAPRPVLYPSPDAAVAASGGAPAASAGGGVLENKVRILEQQLSTLVKENIELEAELAAALEQGKQEKVAIESDNWNLEESTRLYSEAKMQIDRLGAQIQKERAQCTAEKKELEAMLFDPQVTQQAQLARLAELEDALNDAHRKLEEQRQIYEGRIKLLEAQVGAGVR